MAVNQARPTRGIWPGDLSQRGLTVSSLSQVQDDAIILPNAHPLTGILRHDAAWQVLRQDPVATVFTRVGFAP